MTLPKLIATYLVAAQMIFVPVLSHAQVQVIPSQKGVKYTNKFSQKKADHSKGNKEQIFETRLDLPNNQMLIFDRKSNSVVSIVDLQKENVLKAFSPANINKKLKAEMGTVKGASRAAWSHTVRAFPAETATFMIALGGMTAVQLMMDYANNPVAMKHHIDHQLSPVGQIGFFMFMYSQGITTNALNAWLKRPKLGMPIAMFGMTVGMAVQTYFSQVAMDPHVRQCAAAIFKKEKFENNPRPCEDVYKYLVVDKKILEGPAVVSLLGSFLATVGARALGGAVLRMAGIELALWITPGGMQLKGARWIIARAANGLNIAAFTVIQMKLEHMLAFAWKNYFDGKEFIDVNNDLVAEIEAQKKSQWQKTSSDLDTKLKDFHKKMSEWRVTNLSDVYMAHQAWSELLLQLTSGHAAAYSFYSLYTDALKDTKAGDDEGTLAPAPMDKPYPLFGVTPKGLAEGHEDLFFTHRDRIEAMQIETTEEVAAWIAQNMERGYYKKQGFNKEQMKAISDLQQGLANSHPVNKGRAILEMNKLLAVDSVVGSMLFNSELQKISDMLGSPQPLFEPGRGFAASMALSPGIMSDYKDFKFDTNNGRFDTRNVIDFFLVQMVCGPDLQKNEKVISLTKGFPAKFNAPAIVKETEDKEKFCFGKSTQPIAKERLYNLPFSKQKTIPEYLRANMTPELKDDFIKWWEKGAEAELKAAFKGFNESYKVIVEKLYQGLETNQYSRWNRGFMANGVFIASFQEFRFYSLLLGEILKDTYKVQKKKDLPQSYFSAQDDDTLTLAPLEYKMSPKPLLALLARGKKYDFNTLLSTNPNATTHSLMVQKNLEGSFREMISLIRQAKNTRVKSDEFMKKMDAIDTSIKEFGELLGVDPSAGTKLFSTPEKDEKTDEADQEEETPSAKLVTLDADKKALVVTCLELLQAIGQELVTYGSMVGTATYPEQKKDVKANAEINDSAFNFGTVFEKNKND